MKRDIRKDLLKLKDEEYKSFLCLSIPNYDSKRILGVNVPKLKDYLKILSKDEIDIFLKDLPHKYLDEDLLHSLIISDISDYGYCVRLINQYTKYIDNWLVADEILPKSFKGHEKDLIKDIRFWLNSKEIYASRLGINTLMNFYLNDYFSIDFLDWVANVEIDDYYLKQMKASFFVSSLISHYEETLNYLKMSDLDNWTLLKIVSKAQESSRINDDRKEEIKSLKECRK